MAGIPGSGKSTIARQMGRRTGAVVLDKDVIMAAAIRVGHPSDSVGGLAYEVGYDLAASILANGMSVILDTPANFILIREKGACVAGKSAAEYFIVQCTVTEPVAAGRIATREPVHALHPTSLTQVDLSFERNGTAPLFESHLDIDTTQPLDVCVRQVLEYIGR
jgi:predicted kinase